MTQITTSFWWVRHAPVAHGGRIYGQIDLSCDCSGRDIIAVAHGGTIRAALALALDLDPEAALAFTIENCSITRIDRIDGPGMGHGWRVVRVNQPPR